jgi:FMN phosphatase YigB (HAD superfamily)
MGAEEHPGRLGGIRAVVLDVGETLVDETRQWSAWADYLGLPRLTFLAVLGAVIARGGHHRDVFEELRPGFDLAAAEAARRSAGEGVGIVADDFYPDARPCIAALLADGIQVGIAGNQPAATEAVLRTLDPRIEMIGSSERWGVEKPASAFFARIVATLGLPAAEIAYAGDRVDNDVRPAAAAGLVSVFLRRGPWAWIQAGGADPPEAALVVRSLAALPRSLRTFRQAGG